MASKRSTPDEVVIRRSPRVPETDPKLGVDVTPAQGKQAKHRLVTIGDSLTHGFMSGAIHRTDLSWPAIAAFELGLTPEQFTYPTYEWPTGPGGLPFDLERFARSFEQRFGAHLDFREIVSAGLWIRSYMDEIEDFWEREDGSHRPAAGASFHNTAVYGWDPLDPQLVTTARIESKLKKKPDDDLISQLVDHHAARAAWPVLRRAGGADRTVLDAVADLSQDGDGVETLVVVLGANNALGSVISLEPAWTPANYAKLDLEDRLTARNGCNLWRPSAFAADWESLVARLRTVQAQHVIFATVPSVTIAPIARGVYKKIDPTSRYFPYYTRPWITDDDFDPKRDPHLTADEVRAIDSAIDSYNETIIASVKAARTDGLDWYLFDMGSLLDRLATRRYVTTPWAQPSWWTPYELPAALQALDPVPNTRFFRAGPGGRTDGGLFSLDGVHPTTVAYGVLAQEVIKVMELAGVEFLARDGTPRPGPVQVDFERLLKSDTLISSPPASISNSLSLLGWLDDKIDWVTKFLPFVHTPL